MKENKHWRYTHFPRVTMILGGRGLLHPTVLLTLHEILVSCLLDPYNGLWNNPSIKTWTPYIIIPFSTLQTNITYTPHEFSRWQLHLHGRWQCLQLGEHRLQCCIHVPGELLGTWNLGSTNHQPPPDGSPANPLFSRWSGTRNDKEPDYVF